MKKAALLLGIAAAFVLSGSAAYADTGKATVKIPTYKCIIDNSDVYYQDSKYPLISYKDVTYFPMTWGYCNALGLSSQWVDGQGLYIAYHDERTFDGLPTYQGTQNKKTYTVSIPSYPIYINGKQIDNGKQEYPLLNFRDITYFPMTWKFAHEEFNWGTDWADNTFTLTPFSAYEGVSDHYEVKHVGSDSAELELYKSWDEPIGTDEDGDTVYTVKDSTSFFRLDYATGKLTEIGSLTDGSTDGSNETVTAVIADGAIVCEGQKLHAVDAVVNGGKAVSELELYVDRDKMGANSDVDVYNFRVYTDMSVPAPYTPYEEYAYVKTADSRFVFIGEKGEIVDAARSDNGIYVNFSEDLNWKGWTSPLYDLYLINSDGSVTDVGAGFKDYEGMKILGYQNGKLYLKCEWGGDFSPGSWTYRISPYKDGYYTLSGGNLTKVANYVDTDGEILTPAGGIFGIINWKGEIRRIV